MYNFILNFLKSTMTITHEEYIGGIICISGATDM